MNGKVPTGFEGNDAGHVVANTLGGTGKETYNIIPQSSHFNKGVWKNQVEKLVFNEVIRNGNAKYTIKPIYVGESTRPTRIHYRIESGGRVLAGDIENPVIKKKDIKDKHFEEKDSNVKVEDIEETIDFSDPKVDELADQLGSMNINDS